MRSIGHYDSDGNISDSTLNLHYVFATTSLEITPALILTTSWFSVADAENAAARRFRQPAELGTHCLMPAPLSLNMSGLNFGAFALSEHLPEWSVEGYFHRP